MAPARALRSLGLVGLLAAAIAQRLGRLGLVEGLVLVGMVTVVPLGASLVLRADRYARFDAASRAAAILIGTSTLLASIAAFVPALALASRALHLLAALALALAAARSLAWRGPAPLDELAIDVGALLLPIGAAFGLASRAGVPLLGFREPILGFTAAHFHYAGFAAPIVFGAIGRLGHGYGAPTSSAYRVGTIAVIAGIPLTAAGIAGGAVLERASALLLACGMLIASANGLRIVRRRADLPGLARATLALSFLGLLVPMALASAFALTGSAGRGRELSALVPLATMLRFHGAVNALVFAVPALLALTWLAPAPRHRAHGFATSRLRGGLVVGPDFFARVGALGTARAPSGILDSLDDYASSTFEPARVDPEVRRFYERVIDYRLDVTPRWSPGFRLGGRLWRAIARRIGQVELPTEASSEAVTSHVVDLRDEVDGRAGARGWVRTYAESGRSLYVAAYAATRSFERTLMNVAFPLPGCALVSVLRFDDVPTPGGLRVTTSAPPGELVGDEGIFVATRFGTLRLPMTEWVEVVPAAIPGELHARHELFLFRRRYLRLDYRIVRDPRE